MSDTRVTYEYMWLPYKWHASTYEWHTDEIQVNASKCEWHTDDIWVHTSDIQTAYEWHANDKENFKPCKGFGVFKMILHEAVASLFFALAHA